MSTKKQAASQNISTERSVIGNALIEFRARMGWTQRGLAAAIGVSQGAVSQWEMAGTEKSKRVEPTPMALLAIAKLDHERRNWWLEQAGPKYAQVETLVNEHKKTYGLDEDVDRRIGIFRSPGHPANRFPQENEEGRMWLPREWFGEDEGVKGLRVRGSSFAPLIQEGYIVLVSIHDRTDFEALSGQLVACREESGVSVRRLGKVGDAYHLFSYTMESQMQVKSGDNLIVGRVIRWIGLAT